MCTGKFTETPVVSGAQEFVIPEGIKSLPSLLQAPRQVIQEMQRRANMATQRSSAA